MVAVVIKLYKFLCKVQTSDNLSHSSDKTDETEFHETVYAMRQSMAKIDQMHAVVMPLAANLANLSTLVTISETLTEMKHQFVDAAIGRDQVPKDLVKFLMQLMAGIAVALVATIVFLLTGAHWGWVDLFHK